MTLSFAEIDRQHVELLPPRTVMSLFSLMDNSTGGSTVTIANKHSCLLGIPVLSLPLPILGVAVAGGTGSACGV